MKLRICVFALCVGLCAGLAAQNAHLSVYVPHSGDVDHDGVLTTHDAQLILEILSGMHSQRPDLQQILDACDINLDGVCDTKDANQILAQVVSDYSDYDGDGVPNAFDCAPLDARIATQNRYFPDLDLDGFGSTAGASSCAPQPPVPNLAWGNDVNDSDPYSYLPPAPKGNRMLGVDMADLGQDQMLHPELLESLGAEATALRLDWVYLESSPFVFNGPQAAWLKIANTNFAQQGLAVTLSLDPIVGKSLALPPDLSAAIQAGTLRFSSPAVLSRYLALLAFVHQQIPSVQLVSLQIGYNVDLYAANPQATSQFWADFYSFYAQMAIAAKALWGQGLKVGIDATTDGLLTEPTRSLMLALNQNTDVVDVTFWPHQAGYAASDPQRLHVELDELVSLYPHNPVYLQSVAMASAPVAGSSETRQSQLLYAFFDAWDQYGSNIPFVCFSRLFDLTPSAAAAQALQITSTSDPNATGMVLSMGLVSYDGRHQKSAFGTLRNLAFQRGWMRFPARTTRSFRLGFTPALYDVTADLATFETVESNVWNAINTDSDITALHFDSGVPWVEALADDLTSATPPYSASLLSQWNDLKSRLPAGHKLLVSINPLGVPRQTLAPYWGYGEGFRFSDSFGKIPIGVWADSDNRLLPPPWNTYNFNTPEVEAAFLKYCIRVIDFFHPDYLVTTIEASAVLAADASVYPKLVLLQQYLYQNLKALSPYNQVPIVVSFSGTTFMTDEFGVPIKYEDQGEGSQELQMQGLYDMLPYLDMVGISLYPHYSKYNATVVVPSATSSMFEFLQNIGKPYGITESGYDATYYDLLGIPFLGSADKQDAYLRLLFAEAEKYPSKPAFIVNYAVRDLDTAWNELLVLSETDPTFMLNPTFVQFSKYFRDIGMFDVNGNPRAATATWMSELGLPYAASPQ